MKKNSSKTAHCCLTVVSLLLVGQAVSFAPSAQAGNANIPEVYITMTASDFNAVNSGTADTKIKRKGRVKFRYPGQSSYRFDVQCEIRNYGGQAVHNNNKRSFRAKFTNRYNSGDPTRLNYPVFERAPMHAGSAAASGYNNLVLRGGGNEQLATPRQPPAWSTKQQKCITYLKDQFMRSSQLDMSGLSSHGTFCHLYVNRGNGNEYWGLYNLAERPDHTFASQYLGGVKNGWASKRGSTGDLTRWNQLWTYARNSNFTESEKRLAVEQFVDYIILHFYGGGGDWSNYNHWSVIGEDSAGKCYFFSWDEEFALNGGGDGYSPTVPGANIDFDAMTYGGTEPFEGIWEGLIKTSQFKAIVNARAWKHLKNGGALTDAKAKARFDTLKNFIHTDDFQREVDRWSPDKTIWNVSNWNSECAEYRSYMTGVADRLFDKMLAKGWVTNTDPNQDPPAIAVSTTSISVSCEQGQNAANKTFQVWNSGDGTLQYKLVESTSSLSVSPTTGSSTGSTDKKTHTIAFTTSGLAVGTHNKTISVQDNGSGASNGPITINVTITVDPPALQPPSAPSALAATALSTSRIGLSWTDNSDNEQSFKIDRRQSGTDPWVRIAEPSADVVSHTDTGLPADTIFYYKIKAWNEAGNSAYSALANAATQPDIVPEIAVSTTAIAVSCEQGSDAPDTSFQVWNGGTGTLLYELVETSSTFSVAPTTGSSTGSTDKKTHTISFTTAGLAVGTHNKKITVQDNGSGAANGPITIDLTITVDPPALQPPAAPSGLTASAASTSSIALGWADNSDNEQRFKIDRRESGTDPWVRIAELSPDVISHTDTGLPADTKFYYKVKAWNEAGNSAYTAVADATTEPDVVPELAVSTTAIAVSCEEGSDAPDATIQVWNAGTGTLDYQLVETSSKLSIAPTTGSSTGSADKNTHTVSFATASMAVGTYTRMFTVEDNGSGASNGPITVNITITVTTPVPAAPTGLAATALSPTSVALTWNDLPDETQYMLRKSLDGSYWYDFDAVYPTANVTSYTDSGLDPETTYYYKIRGQNDGGNGPYCDPVSVTTPAATAPEIAVSTTAISVACEEGSDAPDASIQVWNAGTGTLDYQLVETSSKLSIAPTTGSSTDSTDKNTHTVSFSTATMAVGTHTRMFTVEDNGSGAVNGPITVDITITVTAPTVTDVPVAKGATWSYHEGTTAASTPAAVWRHPAFDAGAWAQGPAPFGYGDGPYGTTLGGMRDNYTCLFLRRSFTVEYPARVGAIHLWTLYDDGFVVWINGKEVARHNVDGAPGSTPPYDGLATSGVGDGTEWTTTLTGADLPVLAGTNLIAVQVFNVGLTSSDLTFDAELTAEYGTPPGTDADSDGMPDEWEQVFLSGLSDPSELSDTADPDNDGRSNIQEWIAGTDPGDETGYLKLETRLEQGQIVVSWQAVPAEGSGYDGLTRHYGLQRRSDPATDAWTDVADYADLTATAAQSVTYTVPDPSTPAQYRVKVWLE